MKKIFLYILSVVAFGLVSCEDLKFGDDFLQKPPSSDVTIDTVFSKKEYAERVLWYTYQNLPVGWNAMGLGTIEALTDLNICKITYTTPCTQFYTGTYTAKAQQNGQGIAKYDGNIWKSVRNCWLFIQNVDRVPDMDSVEKKRLTAEAKMMVAMYYSYLLRNFGALPIIDHPLTAEEEMPARATLQETVDFIVKLLDEAIACNEFPWRLSDEEMPNWFGRLTRAGAMALKARVLLFTASPLFNSDQPYLDGEAAQKKMVWFGNYEKDRWKLAMDACEDFFNALKANGFYKLVQKEDAPDIYPGYKNDYRYAFRAGYFDRGTTETLISTNKGIFSTSQMTGNLDQPTRWGGLNPTLELLDMFDTDKGDYPDWDEVRATGVNIYENRDPRLYETLLVDGDQFKGMTLDLVEAKPGDAANYPKGKNWGNPWVLSPKSLQTGFGVRKWALDRQGGGEFKNHPIQWPFLRLPEMYLSYAEAINEYKGGPTEEAYKMINTVRKRVGLKELKDLNQEQFRAALLKERACEFAWEEVRYYDLTRWKRTDIFSASTHELHAYRHKVTKKMEYNKVPMSQTDVKRKWWEPNGWDNKWLLSAFPMNEVNKGYGLVQNPGWE